MGDERVCERARGLAGARMHHETGGLVDHDERIILVNHVERDGLARDLGHRGGGDGDLKAVARFDPIFGVLYGRAA